MANPKMTLIKDEGQAIMLVFGIVLLIVLGFFLFGGLVLFTGLPNYQNGYTASNLTPTADLQQVSGDLNSGSSSLKEFKSGDCKFDISYSSAHFKAQTVAKGSYRNLLGTESSGVKVIAEKYKDASQGEILVECLDYPTDAKYDTQAVVELVEKAIDVKGLKYTAKVLNSFSKIGNATGKQLLITYSSSSVKPQEETIYVLADDSVRIAYAVRIILPADEIYKKPFNEAIEKLTFGVSD